ncbi:hypothetical protein LCGC14_2171630, partial [marine sediment metagenome]
REGIINVDEVVSFTVYSNLNPLFVLSDYAINLKRIKLKPYIINGWFWLTYENPRGFSIQFLFAKFCA